jgi:NADPH-dependent glutamate synthase beta subunit-like oxidoreductase
LRVAIVGAGPAGIYAADVLMKSDTEVSIDLYERQPAPFGLIRYGVAPDHPRIKGIVKALHQVLSKPQVRLFGNVEYGVDVKLDELRRYYDAVVFTTGAEKDRDLDIPGIDKAGSFGGADFVSWFDGHPDVPREWPLEAESIAVVGAGNVALDVARMLSKTAEELLVTEIPDNVYPGWRPHRCARCTSSPGAGRRRPSSPRSSCASWTTRPTSRCSSTPRTSSTTTARSRPSTPTTRPSWSSRAGEVRDAHRRRPGRQAPAQAVAALLRVAGRGARRRPGRGLPHRAHRADR